jgi:hypothetical protein
MGDLRAVSNEPGDPAVPHCPDSAARGKNADYLDWDAFGYVLAEHVQRRNSPAERERHKTEAAKRRQRRTVQTTSELNLAA